jgi:transposase
MATATVHQAYRFALDPTPRQQRRLASHVGAARFAYNWGLAVVNVVLPRLGRLKTHESTRKLARRLEAGPPGS